MAPKKMTNAELHKIVIDLTARLERIERKLPYVSQGEGSLEKTEKHGTSESGLAMTKGDVVRSMKNALVILNPKLIDGKTKRHTIENVAAIVGKKHGITEELMDLAYELFKKEER
jgi:uncharacterized protein (UPF0218 family)